MIGPRMGPTNPVDVNRGRARVRNTGFPMSFNDPPATDVSMIRLTSRDTKHQRVVSNTLSFSPPL